MPLDRLDAIWPAVALDARRPYLKIDTQGFELEILYGTLGVLDAIVVVEVELSLLTTYDAGPLFSEVYSLLRERGFAPIAFEGVLDDEATGEMLQVDGIFRRGHD